jgi:hypothetical protein
MRPLTILFSLILLLGSCSDQDYSLEQEELDCFYSEQVVAGVDVQSWVNAAEDTLVKYGALKNKSGESYMAFIQNLSDIGSTATANVPLMNALRSIDGPAFYWSLPFIMCSDRSISEPDSTELSTSHLRHLNSLLDTLEMRGDISVSIAANAPLQLFSAEDFEHNYYRTLAVIVFTRIIWSGDRDSGILPMLQPVVPEHRAPQIASRNMFTVMINRDDEILVNGAIVTEDELSEIVKKFYLDSAEKDEIEWPGMGKVKVLCKEAILTLRNDRGSSYEA